MTILFPQTIVEKGGGSYPNNCSILFISKGKGSGLISLLNYIFLTQGNMRDISDILDVPLSQRIVCKARFAIVVLV